MIIVADVEVFIFMRVIFMVVRDFKKLCEAHSGGYVVAV